MQRNLNRANFPLIFLSFLPFSQQPNTNQDQKKKKSISSSPFSFIFQYIVSNETQIETIIMHLDRSNNSDQKQKIIINNQTRVVKYPNHINKPTHIWKSQTNTEKKRSVQDNLQRERSVFWEWDEVVPTRWIGVARWRRWGGLGLWVCDGEWEKERES